MPGSEGRAGEAKTPGFGRVRGWARLTMALGAVTLASGAPRSHIAHHKNQEKNVAEKTHHPRLARP